MKSIYMLMKSKYWDNVYGPDDPPLPPPPPGSNNTETNNTDQTNDPPPERRFTQVDVDRFLAEDRRKAKANTEKIIQELEGLKKNKNLSEQERANLAARIEELQNQVLTKEQLLEKERTRLQTEHRTEIQREREEKENWRNRYTEATITRALTDAAVEAGAYSPEQIVSFLEKQTRLVEDVDAEGNGLGTFSPKVKFKDVDSEGKPVILDLTVQEALKRMKDLPDRFGNLFKAGVTGGLGGNGSVDHSRDTNIDASRIKSVNDYARYRERITGKKTKK